MDGRNKHKKKSKRRKEPDKKKKNKRRWERQHKLVVWGLSTDEFANWVRQTFPSVPDVTEKPVIAELLMRLARDRRAKSPFQCSFLYHDIENVPRVHPAFCLVVTGKFLLFGAQTPLDWQLSRHRIWQNRAAFFWASKQRVVVISYRRFAILEPWRWDR